MSFLALPLGDSGLRPFRMDKLKVRTRLFLRHINTYYQAIPESTL